MKEWWWRIRHRWGRAVPTEQFGNDTADISVADLRLAITRLLDAVEAEFGAELHLPDDFYWDVPLEEATQILVDPELGLGSVVDDAESVREFISRADPSETFIWHDANHISGVLRSIARLDLP